MKSIHSSSLSVHSLYFAMSNFFIQNKVESQELSLESPTTGADFVPSNDRFDPTEPPLLNIPPPLPNPRFLWCLHLNEPACVVGEHRHLPLDDFANPFGVRGEPSNAACLLISSASAISSILGFSVFIFIFSVPCSLCSSASLFKLIKPKTKK